MALKPRLIPVLLLSHGQVVQTVRFKITNPIHPIPWVAVEAFDRWAADEILVLDISRTQEQRDRFYVGVSQLAMKCFVPLTVGGWVTSVDEAAHLFALGADKVTVNTAALERPSLIRELAERWGSQAVVLSIDCGHEGDGRWRVVVDRGRRATGVYPVEWARALTGGRVNPGAGEILLTAINHEGVGAGYALDLVRTVASAVSVPVIAFGGAATAEHLAAGLKAGASAVALATAAHYIEVALRKLKDGLRAQGVDCR